MKAAERCAARVVFAGDVVSTLFADPDARVRRGVGGGEPRRTGPRVAVVLSICAVDADVGSGLPDPLRRTA